MQKKQKIWKYGTQLLWIMAVLTLVSAIPEPGTKTIYLMRHAKTKDAAPSGKDVDRALEEKGWADAIKMGLYLKRTKQKIDLIIASPSVRTRQTAVGVCKHFSYDSTKIVYDSSLYRCTDKEMMEVIKKLDNKYHNVLVIAHNPATTLVANRMQEKQYTEVPTGAVVAVQAQTDNWTTIMNKKYKQLFFVDPRDLDKNGKLK